MRRRCNLALSLCVSASLVVGLVPAPALAQMVEPTPPLEAVAEPEPADLTDADLTTEDSTAEDLAVTEHSDADSADLTPQSDTTDDATGTVADPAADPATYPADPDDVSVEVQSDNSIGGGRFEATFASDGSLQYATDYTGAPVELPNVKISFWATDSGEPIPLTEGVDFEFDHYIDGDDNSFTQAPTEPGPYFAVYRGINTYTGTRSVFFRIIGYDEIAHGDYQVEWIDGNEVTYTGEPVSAPPARIYRCDDTQGAVYLEQDEDFEVAAYYDADHQDLEGAPVQTGTYYVEYRGIGSYHGLRSAEFEVCEATQAGDPGNVPKSKPVAQTMSLNVLYVAQADQGSYWLGKFTAPKTGVYSFASTGQCDTVGYLYADADLEHEIDYSDDETDENFRIVCNLAAGETVYLKVCECGDGELNTQVSVAAVNEYDLANASIWLNGDAIDPTTFLLYPRVQVTSVSGATLVEGTDYVLVYYLESDNSYYQILGKPTTAGSYKIVAQAKSGSSYQGQTEAVYFEVRDARDLSTQGTIQLENAYYYEWTDDDCIPVYLYKDKGTAVTPDMWVRVGSVMLDSSDYTVIYSGNDVAGMATVTVRGKGDFYGSISAQFKLVSHLDFARYAGDNYAKVTALGETHSVYLNNTEPLEFLANGFQVDPQVTFFGGQFEGQEIPAQGRDFDVSFANAQGVDIPAPSAAGTYQLVLKATQTGILIGTVAVPITITAKHDLAGDYTYPTLVTPDSYCYDIDYQDSRDVYNVYDPQDFNPVEQVVNVVFSLRDEAVMLVENLDYVVSSVYDSLLELWTYTFTGMGSYEGTADARLYINAPDSVQESFNFRAATATINGRTTVFVDKDGKLVQPDVRLEGLAYGVDYKFGGFRDANGKTILSAAVGDTVTLLVTGLGAYAGCERTMACKVQQGTGAVNIAGGDTVLTVENGVYAYDGDQRVWYLKSSLTPIVSLKVYGSSKLILRENEGFTTTSTTANGVRNLTLTADDSSIVSGTRQESVRLVNSYDLASLVTRVRFTDACGDETLYIMGKSEAATLAYSGVDYMPVVEFVSNHLFLNADVELTLRGATGGPVQKIDSPGGYLLEVQGKGDWTGSFTIPLTVTQTSNKVDLSKCTLEVGTNTQLDANGQARPTVTLTCAGTELDPTRDYTVEYGSNTQVGKRGWVKVTAMAGSQFTGTAKANFTVGASAGNVLKNSEYAVFLAEPSGGDYYNTAEETRVYKLGFNATTGPAVKVMRKGKGGTFTPLDASNYSVAYGNLDNDGMGYVKITGKNGYSGTLGANFYVSLPARTSIAKATVTLTATSFTYDGKQKNVAVASVVLNGKKLVAGTDYKVTAPKGRISAGTYTYTVTGKGAYKDTAQASFVIKKAANPMTAKVKKKTLSVTYNPTKVATVRSNVTVQDAQGTVTYASAMSKAYNKMFAVNKTTGAVAVNAGTKVGTYTIKLKVKAAGDTNYNAKTVDVSFTLKVVKAKNPLTIKLVTRTVSLAALKKGNVTVACPAVVSGAVGKVTYAKVSGDSCLTINATNGKVTVKKGTKKGTYSIKIKVTAAGDANYKAISETVTGKIVVKSGRR